MKNWPNLTRFSALSTFGNFYVYLTAGLGAGIECAIEFRWKCHALFSCNEDNTDGFDDGVYNVCEVVRVYDRHHKDENHQDNLTPTSDPTSLRR